MPLFNRKRHTIQCRKVSGKVAAHIEVKLPPPIRQTMTRSCPLFPPGPGERHGDQTVVKTFAVLATAATLVVAAVSTPTPASAGGGGAFAGGLIGGLAAGALIGSAAAAPRYYAPPPPPPEYYAPAGAYGPPPDAYGPPPGACMQPQWVWSPRYGRYVSRNVHVPC
jgi:hypothetical protein